MDLKQCSVVAALGGVLAGCGLDGRPLGLPSLGDAGGPGGGGLEVSPSTLDLGGVATGSPARARLALRNAAEVPLPAPAIGWAASSDPEFVLLQNLCEGELGPGASCELRVQVVPTHAGALHGTLEVQGVASVALSALGMEAGDLVLAPAAGSFEDFGGVTLGAVKEGTFTLSNPGASGTGALQLGVNRPEFALAEPAPGECVAGATALEPGQACDLRLLLSPLVRGPLDATLTISSEAAGSVSAPLSGRGLAPGLLEASAPALDFEGVLLTQSARRGVTLANGGDEPLVLSGTSLEPAGVEGFTIANGDCAASTVLDGGERCSVEVEFRPTSAGVEMTAELVASDTAAAEPLRLPLRGVGLQPGSLELGPVVAGDERFGDVLLGASAERRFMVTNPGAQPSGVLEWTTSEGFEVLAPPAAGECEAGSSSLVDGESCTLRVRFTPERREATSGTLTLSSPLAGAVALAMSGRGVIAGTIEVEPEVSFGRVLTGATAERSLSLRNGGDTPLPPPALELGGADAAQVAAFTAQSDCAAALAPGEECALTLSFAPTLAVPHAATLRLAPEGSAPASVLLLGEALVPGSLVLAPAEPGAEQFGDVALGASARRSFTLTNPGAVPSGPLTLTSDDRQFLVEPGECAAADLVDGASCSFEVSFTPTEASPAAGNVTARSTGAGGAGIAVSGRGRRPAALAAAGNRDLGRATVGQPERTAPENEFTWTVDNTGDLATGALAVTNDNPQEFTLQGDTCSGAPLAGQASCALTIRFAPAAAGPRTGRVTLSDPAAMLSAPIALTGLGVLLAAPGQSCVNAECETGQCTRAGVCCDTPCDRACEVCSASGACTALSGREPCGAGAACFGVDQCKLPEGAACSAPGGEAQCGSGFCAPRLGGAGALDRICCLESCAAGLACNAQGRCEQPTAGDGIPCGGPGDLPCGEGLVCKACVGDAAGQSQCKPAAACCGDCGPGLECVDGASCGCPAGADGQRGLPCAGGCALNRDGACCPEAPDCDPGEVCDASDNLCKQCASADDCTSARPGSVPTCTAEGTCAYPCGGLTPQECTDGRCIGASECCEDCQGRGCTDGVCAAAQCTGDERRCSDAGVPQGCAPSGLFVDDTPCSSGEVCDPATGACAAPPREPRPIGAACPDGVCDEGTCTAGVCCELCTDVCTACAPTSGRCEAVPEDEPRCEPVSCAGGGECEVAGSLTPGSCRGLGVCKTAADCSPAGVAPRGTPCDTAVSGDAFCDGAGGCIAPTVFCGLSSCTIDAETTCCYRGGETSVEPVCTSRAGCIQGDDFFYASPVECDNLDDCRTGEVCCYTSATTSSVTCTSVCQSSPVSSAQAICQGSGVPVGFDRARFPQFVCN